MHCNKKQSAFTNNFWGHFFFILDMQFLMRSSGLGGEHFSLCLATVLRMGLKVDTSDHALLYTPPPPPKKLYVSV